nr:MAG TPA: hypothetical protein [Caudoviricetes sp.]
MYYDKFVLADGSILYDNIVSVSWTEQVNSDSDNITPGAVCANAIDISFWIGSDDTLKIAQGTKLTYYKVDDYTAVETKIGVFTCEKPEKDGSNKYKVTAYDNVTKLDIDVSDWLNALTFPVSISSFATQLATKCGLEFANTAPINGDYSVQAFTATNVTGRELMKMVAQAAGSFIRANADGKLEYAWYVTNSDLRIAPHKAVGQSSFLYDIVPRQLDDNVPRNLVTSEGYHQPANDKEKKSLKDKNIIRLRTADVIWEPESTPYFMNQLTFSDFTVTAIDKVQVKQSDNDVGVIYPGDATGTNALIVSGNKLLVTDSDATLRPYVKNLYDRLNNMVYVPCSNIQTPETIQIRAGDIVTVTDGKREFVTWITSVKHSGNKCTFESVGSIVRNTTTAVNNAKYSAKHRVAEIQTNLDGISAKLGEYSTKSETESAISVAIDKIQLGITEKTKENLMDGYTTAKSVKGASGSVTFDKNKVATVISPNASETGDIYNGAFFYMPAKNLESTTGTSLIVAIEYKVNEKVSVADKNNVSKIVVWTLYPSGNLSYNVVLLGGTRNNVTTDVCDWTTKKIKIVTKNETPSSVYIFSYLSAGTGNISVRNPYIYHSESKESVISLTKDGVAISSSVLDLNAFTSNNEVRSRFAMDSTSATIESGVITFKGNTLVVDSDNFKLTKDGAVSITGTLTSQTNYTKAVVGNGEITLSQLISGGSYSPAVKIYSDGVGGSHVLGHIRIYGNDGADDKRIDLYNDSGGSHFEMFTGGNKAKFFDVKADSNGEGHVSIGGVNGLGYLECKYLMIDGHIMKRGQVNYLNQEGTPVYQFFLQEAGGPLNTGYHAQMVRN